MRLAICGHGRHGKGTVAAWLRDNTALRYERSTSEAAAELVYMSTFGQRYADVAECWADRHNHRETWADIIWRHNKPDGITLYEEMAEKNDIIEGIRRPAELMACLAAGVVEAAIWVDASKRKPPDASNMIRPENCHLQLDNNGPWSETVSALYALCDTLAIPTRKHKRSCA